MRFALWTLTLLLSIGAFASIYPTEAAYRAGPSADSLLREENESPQYSCLSEAFQIWNKLGTAKGPANINWINGGHQFAYFSQIADAKQIKTVDLRTMKEEVILEFNTLRFHNNKPFDYHSFNWSDDSKLILFKSNFRPVWRRSGRADFYLYELSSKSLQLVAKDARTAEISPDGKKVAYEKEGDLFIYDVALKQEKQLTNNAGQYRYNGRSSWVYEEEFGVVQAWEWSPNSLAIAFWHTDEEHIPLYQLSDLSGQHPSYTTIPYPKVGDTLPEVKIGVIHINQNKTTWMKVAMEDGYIPRLYWTADPDQLAVVHLNRAQNHLQLFFCNVTNGNASMVMEERSQQWIDVIDFEGIFHFFFFPQGKEEFFWISDRDGWSHLYRYDYTGRLMNQVTKGHWEVSQLSGIDSKKETIYFLSTEDSPLERQLYAIGFDGTGKRKLTHVPGNHRINLSPNCLYYFDSYSNLHQPTRVELWDTQSRLIHLYDESKATREHISNHFYSPRELFSFSTEDGQQLDAYIIKPKNFDPSTRYPVLLNVYGGPGSQFVKNEFAVNAWEQYLAQSGYIIVNINNRGSGGYGRNFEKMVYQDIGKWQSYDFVQTTKYLSTLPWVDSANFAIRGTSFGGFTSSFTMLTYPEVFKVALVSAPVIDWMLYDCVYTERFMNTVSANPEGYKKNNVANYTANLKGKMLLAHSLLDDNVHFQNSAHLITSFIGQGKDIDLKIYPPGAHGVSYDSQSNSMLFAQYTDYLNKYLKKIETNEVKKNNASFIAEWAR